MQAKINLSVASGVFGALWLGAPFVAHADLRDPQVLAQLTPFEQRAALANQRVYDQLITDPDGNGPQVAPCGFIGDTALSICTDQRFQLVFENVRELVDTANELTGGGPTTYSLGLDAANLGFALRWTSAEELSAQGASVTEFSNSQLGALAGRLSALRFGASGFRLANSTTGESAVFASNDSSPLGGSAGADGDSIASRWSAFINGSFGYGSKDDTTFDNGFEDAFDFDGQEVTLGIDHRFNSHVVAGVMGGYSKKAIDFDTSKSIVDARIDIDGYSLIAYWQWEGDGLYTNGSLGGQWLDLDTRRRIFYPSFNPFVESVDSTTLSVTSSTGLTATFGAGYDMRRKAMTFGPYFKAEYQDVTIDGFTEAGPNADGFGFNVGDQDMTTFDAAVGFRVQRVLTPSFGVVVPYARVEFHKELENGRRTLSTIYSDSASVATAGDFGLQNDEPDDSYSMLAAGFSVVLKHGFQGFLQYHQVFGLDHYSDHVIAGGVRYEL